jgi:hypothetical protein
MHLQSCSVLSLASAAVNVIKLAFHLPAKSDFVDDVDSKRPLLFASIYLQ